MTWPLAASWTPSAIRSFGPTRAFLPLKTIPQDGWDHVSGYRTTAYVISPYTKRHAVVNTQYNNTSLLRTIELILGIPPMTQMDATATPMFDCFTDTPDFTPYDCRDQQRPVGRNESAGQKNSG